MVKTKTAQYMHDIELHFAEKEKRTQTRDFYRNQKDVVMKKYTTGLQCKPTRNKHGMVKRLTC